MTARKPKKQSPARKQDLISPTNRWDVIQYALDDKARTVRLCLILLAGSVASVGFAALLVLRLWL